MFVRRNAKLQCIQEELSNSCKGTVTLDEIEHGGYDEALRMEMRAEETRLLSIRQNVDSGAHSFPLRCTSPSHLLTYNVKSCQSSLAQHSRSPEGREATSSHARLM